MSGSQTGSFNQFRDVPGNRSECAEAHCLMYIKENILAISTEFKEVTRKFRQIFFLGGDDVNPEEQQFQKRVAIKIDVPYRGIAVANHKAHWELAMEEVRDRVKQNGVEVKKKALDDFNKYVADYIKAVQSIYTQEAVRTFSNLSNYDLDFIDRACEADALKREIEIFQAKLNGLEEALSKKRCQEVINHWLNPQSKSHSLPQSVVEAIQTELKKNGVKPLPRSLLLG